MSTRSLWIGAAAITLVVTALALAFARTGPCDDDFIVQRYAWNLWRGEGLVFDIGQRVEGFTCPALVFVYALVLACGLEPAVVGPIIGFACVIAAAWIAFRRCIAGPWLACLAVTTAIVTSAAFLFHAAQGLGTAAAAMLLVAWFRTCERDMHAGSFILPALCLGLAAQLRPETILFALPFLAAVPSGRRWKPAFVLCVLVGGWVVFRRAYFGEWLPMTYHVKKLGLLDDLSFGARYFARATLDCGIAVMLVVCAIAWLRGKALRERASTAALAGAILTSAGIVWVGGDYMLLARFFVPVLPLVIVLSGDALTAIFSKHVFASRASLVVLALFGAWPLARLDELAIRHEFYEERWIAIGKTLGRTMPPSTRVATSPVGAIGYFSRLPIVDILGITSDEARDLEPDLAIPMKGHQRHLVDEVFAREPEIMILGNGILQPGSRTLEINAWERGLYQDPRFGKDYEPAVIPIDGSYPLPCFRRRATSLRTSR